MLYSAVLRCLLLYFAVLSSVRSFILAIAIIESIVSSYFIKFVIDITTCSLDTNESRIGSKSPAGNTDYLSHFLTFPPTFSSFPLSLVFLILFNLAVALKMLSIVAMLSSASIFMRPREAAKAVSFKNNSWDGNPVHGV